MTKIILPDVLKKYGKVCLYMLVSGILGYVSAVYIAKDANLTVIFAPVINFIILVLKTEIDKEGILKAMGGK